MPVDIRTDRSYFSRVTKRRLAILDAAARLISQQGFTHTSVDDVIREAGLSGKSHFYHYFPSKEALGFEVLDRQFGRFADRGLAILREPMIEPLDRLSLFIDTLVALQRERDARNGSPFGNLAGELADSHEGFRQRLDVVFERWGAAAPVAVVGTARSASRGCRYGAARTLHHRRARRRDAHDASDT